MSCVNRVAVRCPGLQRSLSVIDEVLMLPYHAVSIDIFSGFTSTNLSVNSLANLY